MESNKKSYQTNLGQFFGAKAPSSKPMSSTQKSNNSSPSSDSQIPAENAPASLSQTQIPNSSYSFFQHQNPSTSPSTFESGHPFDPFDYGCIRMSLNFNQPFNFSLHKHEYDAINNFALSHIQSQFTSTHCLLEQLVPTLSEVNDYLQSRK